MYRYTFKQYRTGREVIIMATSEAAARKGLLYPDTWSLIQVTWG